MSDVPAPASPIECVRVERHGGFAGLRASVEKAYTALAPAERAALHRVIAAAGGDAAVPPAPGADRFGYRFSLTHADGSDRSFDVAEDAMPAALAALVRPTLP